MLHYVVAFCSQIQQIFYDNFTLWINFISNCIKHFPKSNQLKLNLKVRIILFFVTYSAVLLCCLIFYQKALDFLIIIGYYPISQSLKLISKNLYNFAPTLHLLQHTIIGAYKILRKYEFFAITHIIRIDFAFDMVLLRLDCI